MDGGIAWLHPNADCICQYSYRLPKAKVECLVRVGSGFKPT